MAQVHVSANDALLDALGSEWAGGVGRLNEFERLFGDAEHVELLNLVGGAFFADVQRILWDDQLLRLTRLTDPPRTAGKDNLTVKRLPDLCEHDEHHTLSLVDAVRCIENLLADLGGQAPSWNVDVATDCIRRLGGTPSQENVRRILKLRRTAAQLRADASSPPGDGSRRGT